MLKRIREVFVLGFSDEERRKSLLFNLLNIALGAVALVMSVVNYFTQEKVLMYITLVYASVSFLNFILVRFCKVPQAVATFLFLLDIMILLTHFIVSGTPQGFSVLWALLVPACAMATFGRHDGIVFCTVVFLDVAFLFWTPYGRSLLQWEYSETFMLRFPFVYITLTLIALYIESIRAGTLARLKNSEIQARYLYRHDALTGLYSRHAFREELEQVFAQNTDERMAALMLDVDDFKAINDSYGHNMGDEVLRTVARLITENTCEHCITCRWGGEEFLSLMQCRHNPWDVAERIRKTVEKTPVTYEGKTVHITISVGIVTAYRVEKDEISWFINQADKAMYVSKSKGKNCTTIIKLENTPETMEAEETQVSFLS